MASKNLVLKDATWNGVESVDFPVSGGGTARYIETSDATAVAADIAQNKTAYVNGSLITGTATPTVPNIQALSVTQNGTYTASGGVDGYSPVTVSVSGGGGDSWSWMGKSPTKVQTYTTEHKKLSETDFATWTWTTTNAAIRAAQNYSPTVTLDTNYDYIQLVKFYIHYDYGNWSPVYALKEFAFIGVYQVFRAPATVQDAQGETKNSWVNSSIANTYRTYSYGSSGSVSFGPSANGLYISSLSSPSTYSNVATFKTPIFYTRGNTTYFSQTAFSNLDMDKSYYDLACEVWRVDSETSDSGYYLNETVRVLNSGV